MDRQTESQPDADSSGVLRHVQLRWRTVLGDVLLVVAWVGVLTFGWGLLRWPAWAYYVAVFGGIVVYSLASDR